VGLTEQLRSALSKDALRMLHHTDVGLARWYISALFPAGGPFLPSLSVNIYFSENIPVCILYEIGTIHIICG
jgi:hypothetical protein